MNLKSMKRTSKAGLHRYHATLTDDLGKEDYELSIHGTAKLVEQAFEKCEMETVIRPRATASDGDAYNREAWKKHYALAKAPQDAVDVTILDKKLTAPTKRNSAVISLRRVRGEGTFWAMFFPNLFVPAGANLFFILPPVCTCSGALFPASGDPDLFLTLNSPLPPVVAASAKGGTAIDSVSFGSPVCFPWSEFSPFFRVNGFRTGVTSFAMSGFGVFP